MPARTACRGPTGMARSWPGSGPSPAPRRVRPLHDDPVRLLQWRGTPEAVTARHDGMMFAGFLAERPSSAEPDTLTPRDVVRSVAMKAMS